MTAMSAPGWYPDPDGSPQLRYFDGNQWTPQTAQPLAGGAQSGPWPPTGGQQGTPPQFPGNQGGGMPPGPPPPTAGGTKNVWVWVALVLVVGIIVGVGSWLLFFRDSTATPPTPSVTEPVDPSTPSETAPSETAPVDPTTPASEPSAEPSVSKSSTTDQPELPPEGAIIEPVAGCPGTAADAVGEPDADGRFTSGAGLSMPAAEGFVPASLQFPWIHESNTQGKPNEDDYPGFITVGTVRAEDGYVDANATAIAMAACVMGSGFYESTSITGTVARTEQIADQDEAQMVLGVDIVGPNGPSTQILYVMALNEADVMHVLVGSVPDADIEAAEAMAAATKDLKLE